MQDEDTCDVIYNRYPNILNFLLYNVERWSGSSAVTTECVGAIRTALDERRNVGILRPETVATFVNHMRRDQKAMKEVNIMKLMRVFNKHPEFQAFTTGLGLDLD